MISWLAVPKDFWERTSEKWGFGKENVGTLFVWGKGGDSATLVATCHCLAQVPEGVFIVRNKNQVSAVNVAQHHSRSDPTQKSLDAQHG
eukprot:3267312-Amphidinium_carterae.10